MDRSDGATLAFKLAGIYVLIEAVKLIPAESPTIASLLADQTAEHTKELIIVGGALAAAVLVLAVVGWVLIARARRLADRMFGGGQATIDFSGQVALAQVVAFSVIGAVLLADGIPRLIEHAANVIRLREVMWGYLRSEAVSLVVLFLELSIGYWLFFMPRLAARLWLSWSDVRSAAPPPDAAGSPASASSLSATPATSEETAQERSRD